MLVAMKPGLDIPQVDGVTYETWDLPNPQKWEAPAIQPLRDHINERVTAILERVTR